MNKATAITDATISELSLVFAEKDGLAYAPINRMAKVLMVKGGEKKPQSWLERFTHSLKGMLVADDVEDKIDNDGDGDEDYEQIVSLLGNAYYNLQNAAGISDDKARSLAICSVIDNLLEQLDEMRKGEDAEKAGARHSAADMERISKIGEHAKDAADLHDKISKHVAKLGEHTNAITKLHGELTPKPLEGAKDDTAPQGANDDEAGEADEKKAAVIEAMGGPAIYGDTDSAEIDDVDKAKKKDDGPPKPYGDVKYADPENGKYPIDTEEHARAAYSYFSMPKNAEKYSTEERSAIMGRIRAACKKFGIELSDENDGKKAAEVDMTEDQIAALVAKASEAAATAAADRVKADSQAQIDALKAELATVKATDAAKTAEAEKAAQAEAAAKAEVDAAKALEAANAIATAKAVADQAKADADLARAEAEAATAAAKAIGIAALKPTVSSSAAPQTSERLQKAIRAAAITNTTSHRF